MKVAMAGKLARVGQSCVLPLLAVALWQWLVATGRWPEAIVSGPASALRALLRLAESGELLRHLAVSAGRLGVGVALGTFCGILLASLVGVSRTAARMLGPSMQALAPVPVLAWIPLFIVSFGIDGSRIALISVGSGLVVYSAAVSAIRETPAEYVELARALEKGKAATLLAVLLPSSAWGIMGGIRIAAALSWVLLLASELIASSEGLGWLIWDARNFSRADEMMAGMVFVGVCGFISDMVLASVQARLVRWRPSFGGLE